MLFKSYKLRKGEKVCEVIENVEIDFEKNAKIMILKRLLRIKAINQPTYTKVIKKLEAKEE